MAVGLGYQGIHLLTVLGRDGLLIFRNRVARKEPLETGYPCRQTVVFVDDGHLILVGGYSAGVVDIDFDNSLCLGLMGAESEIKPEEAAAESIDPENHSEFLEPDTADNHHRERNDHQKQRVGQSLLHDERAEEKYGTGRPPHTLVGDAPLLHLGTRQNHRHHQNSRQLDELGRLNGYTRKLKRAASAVDDLAEQHDVDHHDNAHRHEKPGECLDCPVVATLEIEDYSQAEAEAHTVEHHRSEHAERRTRRNLARRGAIELDDRNNAEKDIDSPDIRVGAT